MQYQIKFVQQTFISLWQLVGGQSDVTFCPAASSLTHPKVTGAGVGSHLLVYMEGSFQYILLKEKPGQNRFAFFNLIFFKRLLV